jgi:hypothetical protein
MAIACLRLVTFLPLRPLFSVPRFFLCIALFTSLEADAEYLRAMVFSYCGGRQNVSRQQEFLNLRQGEAKLPA